MRVNTFSAFSQVILGMRAGQLATLRAQEQLSSGRRILRPSDDPAGAARSLLLHAERARSDHTRDALASGRTQLELAGTALQHGSELLTRARELLLQGMNGTLNDDDREVVASELDQIREQLLEDANLQVDGTFVFGGTRLERRPWEEIGSGNLRRVVYRGNEFEQKIRAGADSEIAISVAGDQVFGRPVPGPARFEGLTGASSGLTANEGSGYAYLVFHHDATDAGTLGTSGVALVDGGNGDTLLGANALTIDASAGTVQLGNGPALTIPGPGERADVVVRNEKGGELHLDFEGWSGAAFSGVVTGQGSVSLDGDTFTTLSFSETDLELSNQDLGQVVHLNAQQVRRAGSELVTFGDTTNPFDLLQGMAQDLRNEGGLDSEDLLNRLSTRLDDLDRVHDELLLGVGVLGARTARIASADTRQEDVGLELAGRISDIEDADLSAVAIDLARSQMILQVAQAAGARVIQTSLLNFLS